jgi:predicted phosphatase
MKVNDFDTVIFDLDDTIWSGPEPDLWAKRLTPPIFVEPSTKRVYDYIGKYIELHDGIEDVLVTLTEAHKNVGFTTVGGWEGVPYDWQPAVMILRLLKLEEFFPYARIIQYRTGKKTKDFIPLGKTLFIDDAQWHLDDIKSAFPSVTVLNRNHFKSWRELL